MSLFDCINRGMGDIDPETGKATIDQRRGREAQARFNALRDEYMRGMDRSSAEALAAADVKREFAEAVATKRHQLSNQIRANRHQQVHIDNHRSRSGKVDPGDALRQSMFKAQNRERAWTRRFTGDMNDFIMKHTRDILGRTRDKAELDLIGREMFGQATGDSVSAGVARGLRDSVDSIRKTYNGFGGNIGYVKNYIPHNWRRKLLERVTADEFADFLIDGNHLDWDQIINPLTGRAFGKGNGSRDFLKAAYDGLVGLREYEPNNAILMRSFGSSKSDQHRILHFKSYDDWKAVMEKFGDANLFNAVVGYTQRMSRDISLMEEFGPNMASGFNWARTYATNISKRGGIRSAKRAERLARQAENMMGNLSGRFYEPANETIAAFFSGTRHLLASAQLGSAVISSVGDVGTSTMSARFYGLSQTKFVNTFVKVIKKLDKSEATQLYGVTETMLHTSAATMRHIGDFEGPEIAKRLSDGVLRASGLNFWTDGIRSAWEVFSMSEFARLGDMMLDELPATLRGAMKRNGMTAEDWNIIRQTSRFTDPVSGMDVIDPVSIRRRVDLDPKQAERLSITYQMVLEEMKDNAVPSRDLWAESQLRAYARPGDPVTELAILGPMQYKSYPIHQFFNVVRQWQELGAGKSFMGALPTRAAYFSQHLAVMAILGAVAMTSKDVSSGREPRDPSDPSFWAAALLQGGGLGILGDFLFQEHNRYGGGFTTTLGGPQMGLLEQLYWLTGDNALEFSSGEDTHFGREMVKFVRQNMPAGSLWQLRLAMERLVFDQIQQLVDPEAYQDFKRRERSARDMGSSDMWWEPGEMLPGF